LSECERYECAESRWEVLAALPVGGADMSGEEDYVYEDLLVVGTRA
jgi:hypothetical protein